MADPISDTATKVPEWLYLVKNEEMASILKASSQFAKNGYDDEFLPKFGKRSSLQMVKPKRNEHIAKGTVPTHYANPVTGRLLSTEKPFDRPKSAKKAPKVTNPILSRAIELSETRSSQRGVSTFSSHSSKGPVMATALIETSKLMDESGITTTTLSKQKNLMDSTRKTFNGTLARIHGSGEVVIDESKRTDFDISTTLPAPSSVLRRYQVFNSASDSKPSLLESSTGIAQLLAEQTEIQQPPRETSIGGIVSSERSRLTHSKFYDMPGMTVNGGPLNSLGESSTVPHVSLNMGATRALQENTSGSTVMGPHPLPRGGAGITAGSILVKQIYMAPVSMLASRWGVVKSTNFSKDEHDRCAIEIEVQPVYFESLMQQIYETLSPAVQAAGGDISRICPDVYDFVPSNGREPLFVADIGTVNAKIKGLPYTGPIVATRAPALADAESNDSKDPQDSESSPPASLALLRKQEKDKKKRRELRDARDAIIAAGGDPSEIIKLQQRMRDAGKPNGGVPTRDEILKEDLKVAVDDGRVSANRLLLRLAAEGDDYAIEMLLQRGLLIDFDPSPWYMKGAGKAREKSTSNRERMLDINDGTLVTYRSQTKNNDSGPPAPESARLPSYLRRDHVDLDTAEKELTGLGINSSRNNLAKLTVGGKTVAKNILRVPVDLSNFQLHVPGRPAPSAVYVMPDVNCLDEELCTPLLHAARGGHEAAVVVLLRHGADARRRNARGQTALDVARAESHTASVALGLKLPGAAARKRNAAKVVQLLDDRSVLVCAQKGDLRRLRHLVEDRGHPVDCANGYGMTPLHFAVMRRDFAMVRFLCEHGAPAGACNSLGQSPSSLALEEQDPELRKQLLDSLTAAEERELREKREKEERERQSHAEQERQRRLVQRLKEATRGTTAGLAVQYALQKGRLDTNPDVKEEKDKIYKTYKGTGPGAGRSMLSQTFSALPSVVPERPAPVRAEQAEDSLAYTRSATEESSKSRVLKTLPETLKKPMSEASRKAILAHADAVAESWNRNVSSYLAHTEKQATVDGHRKFINTRRGSTGDPKLDVAAKEAKFGRNVLDVDPASSRWEILQKAPPPEPDSQKFEAWAKLRFGQLTGF